MSKFKLIVGGVLALSAALAAYLYANQHKLLVLNTKGIIADQEKDLFLFTLGLSLVVVIPVFVMLGLFAWKYRAGNTKARYTPNWDHHLGLEATWWAIPLALISVLAVVAWRSSHTLDPFKPIAAQSPPVKIQVIALQWRWLFIYPEQHIASLDYLHMPINKPINLELTSDAPMNSFWVPQLAGQVYAMSGMSTRLHLMANETGSYRGVSANISGKGFADMAFKVNVLKPSDFDRWVQSAKRSPNVLDSAAYERLAKPTNSNGTITYSKAEPGLYTKVVDKYMPSGHGGHR